MLDQLNLDGMNKVEVAIERIKMFDVGEEGWYVAFSGGKDSVVIKALCDMAGVKYVAFYRVTTVDPPELVNFIKEQYPEVVFEKARYKDGKQITMWNLIPKKKMPPTRIARYCCQYLKEDGGEGRYKMTGVRWAESNRRKDTRTGLEVDQGKKLREKLDPDNMTEEMAKYCMQQKGFILNPIIDWEDEDIWEFIHRYNIPYCHLYDEGFKRLGCIGCPMNSKAAKELERYPKYKNLYLKAFEKMLKQYDKPTKWKNAEDVMKWWLKQ